MRYCTTIATACLVIAWLYHFVSPGTVVAQERVDFSNDILPILKKNCFECHGESAREGGLRFTNKRDAFAENDSGMRAIVPSDIEASELVHRIKSEDDSDVMPPGGDRLAANEIALIEKWISQGADWAEQTQKKHWAYLAPTRPEIPATDHDWPENEVDKFILRKLQSLGLSPANPEAPARLIRRVSLALTGLPPTMEQVDRFVANPSKQAYEAFVDECLDSNAYGERWAQPWLDLARYADSNGFQADQLRESWAYRDWVINAMNNDLPINQFVIEQLAGDLLPDATLSQKIATGFHRTVTCNVEAGVHPEQNRINQIFDRVNTTGTVFLGTTLECAQCHNHKYDPITQDEYYQLFAFFNNTPIEVKLQSGVQYNFYGPTLELPFNAEDAAKSKELQKQLKTLESQLKSIDQNVVQERAKTRKRIGELLAIAPQWVTPKVVGHRATGDETVTVLDDQSVLIGGAKPDTSIYTVRVTSDLPQITAFKLEALTHDSLPGTGPGRGDEIRSNFVLNEVKVSTRTGTKDKPFVPTRLKNAVANFSQDNWDVSGAIDGKPKTGWAIAPKFHEDHWAVFEVANPIKSKGNEIEYRFLLDQNYGRARTLGRVRILATDAPPEALRIPRKIRELFEIERLKPAQEKELNAYLDAYNPERTRLKDQIDVIRKKISALKKPSTLVMVELDEMRDTFKLIRGEYLNPGKQVKMGVPQVLHSFDQRYAKNRLGLAKWIVDPSNPLFARVTVNRWWSNFFGKGLVKSEEDFGVQSEPPTHPDLLDWLASELISNGWSRKQLHKKIVMSAAFRQSAKVTPEHLERDPENKFFARGPRLRMNAEMIRDHGLAASGLLSRKMGGPPVMPYQPDRIWRAVGRNAPKWTEATNEDRYRRGIYIVWRRAAPYPSFVNFDAPDRASCVVKRPVTNTPLQALTLLNDKAYLEMALALARKVENTDGALRTRLTTAMKRCVSRHPDESELKQLEMLYQQELDRFKANPKTAIEFLVSIDPKVKQKMANAAELASFTIVANVLLNLDETINY